MMIDRKHLRGLLAMADGGSLARAAEQLHLTPSALSHQVKLLEDYYGVTLFHRHTKPMRLTTAGHRLLALARDTLPRFEQAERDLARLAAGDAGRLHLAIECHACFEWLMPVLERFKTLWPAVDVDIDLVITSDPVTTPELAFLPLFAYESRLVLPTGHPLAKRGHIAPSDLADQTLITYPVQRARMDVFRYFLQPAGVEPAAVRQAELTAVILLLVANGQGVAALPDWVMRHSSHPQGLHTLPLGSDGLHRSLFAAVRTAERTLGYLGDFIRLAGDYHAGAPPERASRGR
jgi:LysR family transcriptional regulator for metE and metH